MMENVNYKREYQRMRRQEALERDEIRKRDEVLSLFRQQPGQAQAAMKSQVIMERTAVAPEKKKAEDDEYPCLRAMSIGFTICMAIWLVCWFAAQAM